jgi:hypothetical protein
MLCLTGSPRIASLLEGDDSWFGKLEIVDNESIAASPGLIVRGVLTADDHTSAIFFFKPHQVIN